MSTRDLAAGPELAERLSKPGYKRRPERAFILKLETFARNYSQHIAPRLTTARSPRGRRSDPSTDSTALRTLDALADRVGACSATLAPLAELIRRHVPAAERMHGDDLTVPSWPRARPLPANSGPVWGTAARYPPRN